MRPCCVFLPECWASQLGLWIKSSYYLFHCRLSRVGVGNLFGMTCHFYFFWLTTVPIISHNITLSFIQYLILTLSILVYLFPELWTSSLLYWCFRAVVMVKRNVRCFQNIFSFRCRFSGPKQMPVKSKRLPWLVTPHKISLPANYCQSCDLLIWFLSHLRCLVFYFDNFLISRNVFCWFISIFCCSFLYQMFQMVRASHMLTVKRWQSSSLTVLGSS